MARAKKNNGNGRLEEALTAMLQSQADLHQNQIALTQTLIAQQAESNRLKVEADQRFARIEAILLEHSRVLAEHSRILAEHTRILEKLPDAIRDRIGFKAP
jgi:hypothetical protein